MIKLPDGPRVPRLIPAVLLVCAAYATACSGDWIVGPEQVAGTYTRTGSAPGRAEYDTLTLSADGTVRRAMTAIDSFPVDGEIPMGRSFDAGTFTARVDGLAFRFPIPLPPPYDAWTATGTLRGSTLTFRYVADGTTVTQTYHRQ